MKRIYKFNIICSMHCDYHHPNTSTHAYNLHKIMNHLHTLTLVHVAATTRHPQRDINLLALEFYI